MINTQINNIPRKLNKDALKWALTGMSDKISEKTAPTRKAFEKRTLNTSNNVKNAIQSKISNINVW